MKKKILVVDDDIEIGILIRDILASLDHEVIIAQDGLQAIKKTKEAPIDLILLDIRMPFFSDLFFCDAFKQRPQTKHIPVVVVSALTSEEDIKKAYDRGACAYLKKPFQSHELIEIVGKILR